MYRSKTPVEASIQDHQGVIFSCIYLFTHLLDFYPISRKGLQSLFIIVAAVAFYVYSTFPMTL